MRFSAYSPPDEAADRAAPIHFGMAGSASCVFPRLLLARRTEEARAGAEGQQLRAVGRLPRRSASAEALLLLLGRIGLLMLLLLLLLI